jgi:hypothetical protein
MADKKSASKSGPSEAPSKQAEPPLPGRARYRLTGPELPAKVRHAGIMATSPVINATAVMQPLQKNLAGADATNESLILAVADQVERVQAGDMGEIEAMLISQAVGLQTQWASLSRRASSQEYLPQFQAYMTLALKAQAQSRATLQALIEMKQPRNAPTFVQQANITHGHQQVNNSIGGAPLAHAQEMPTAPNKLLEATHEEPGLLELGRIADPLAGALLDQGGKPALCTVRGDVSGRSGPDRRSVLGEGRD